LLGNLHGWSVEDEENAARVAVVLFTDVINQIYWLLSSWSKYKEAQLSLTTRAMLTQVSRGLCRPISARRSLTGDMSSNNNHNIAIVGRLIAQRG